MSAVEAAVDRAIDAFQRGDPVLIYDAVDREGEVDLVYPAGSVTPEEVARLRNDAGGLVCVALGSDVADTFDLPFLSDVLDHPATQADHLGYDERSSFSLTVNHRDTYTGITDDDRSRTITELADAAAAIDRDAYDATDFANEFRAPGHVHLLRAAPGLLADRRGHTEFGVALAERADLPAAAVVCEMLDDRTGGAMSPADARAYAERHDLPYVEGSDLLASLA
jgi:3,4-dihydroxy 2-butanone 4-phosphate synthase